MKRIGLENMKLISIIVPVFNCEEYIETCLDSIIAQTYKNFEVIIVDDGSEDASGNICDDYARRYSCIRVIHQENRGPVAARKAGLKNARGEYIGFVDSDDWIEPEMYEKLLYLIMAERVDVSMCARYEDTENESKEVFHGIKNGRYDKEALREIVYPNMIVNQVFFEWGIFPGLWDKLFRRKLLEPYLMAVDDRIRMGDDAACTYPCILNANSIYVLDECLYHYRQSPFSLVRRCVNNAELERLRYMVLYHSVNRIFFSYTNIFDLRIQWLRYCLFLMVPRADILYKGLERLDYLFPFPNVKKGSRIIIYGMGLWGQRLYNWLKQSRFCEVAGISDRNYRFIQECGIDAVSPESIIDIEHDAIVITASYKNTRDAIFSTLHQMFPKENIYVMDESLVQSKESLMAFGLI